jgi:hypothetical protein
VFRLDVEETPFIRKIRNNAMLNGNDVDAGRK